MIKITKKNIEEIIGRELTNWEYKVITTYIKTFREDKRVRIFWARHQQKTRLSNEAVALHGTLPKEVIFEEVSNIE